MIQHKSLAEGRWFELSLIEQLANAGSEVERSLSRKEKNQHELFEKAFFRALELVDLTIADQKNITRLKELTRMREALVDHLYGDNEYGTTPAIWRTYFSKFSYAARKNK